MSFLRLALFVHVAAASIALTTLWLPMFLAKGGIAHRRIGLVYAWAMGIAAATGLLVSSCRLVVAGAGHRQRPLFLMYVSILAATSLSIGLRSIKYKRRTAAHRHPLDLGLPSLLVVSSFGIVALGMASGSTLLMGFAPVGMFVGGSQLVYWLRPPRTRMDWWFEHMGGMVGSGIGALTAFVAINAPRLGVVSGSIWVWLAPTALGVPALMLWQRYYRRRFDRMASPSIGEPLMPRTLSRS